MTKTDLTPIARAETDVATPALGDERARARASTPSTPGLDLARASPATARANDDGARGGKRARVDTFCDVGMARDGGVTRSDAANDARDESGWILNNRKWRESLQRRVPRGIRWMFGGNESVDAACAEDEYRRRIRALRNELRGERELVLETTRELELVKARAADAKVRSERERAKSVEVVRYLELELENARAEACAAKETVQTSREAQMEELLETTRERLALETTVREAAEKALATVQREFDEMATPAERMKGLLDEAMESMTAMKAEVEELKRQRAEALDEATAMKLAATQTRKENSISIATLEKKILELERRSENAKEMPSLSTKKNQSPRSVPIEAVNAFIFDYFVSKRCDSVGLDELIGAKPKSMKIEDVLGGLAERCVDRPGRSATHMVVVHQLF